MNTPHNPLVALIVGSASDAEVVSGCRRTLDELKIPYEARVLSAHRTPRELCEYVEQLEGRGVKVVIAAAGMSAALAGTVSAHTQLPVFGVPIPSGPLAGVDALLSTAQMPPGVPVGCMAIGPAGAVNAAYMAARILALGSEKVTRRLTERAEKMRDKTLRSFLPPEYGQEAKEK
jgi:phosphoribosylaminoimidazole carboxylase PurE protein